MTIQELHEIRDRMKRKLYKRDASGKSVQISVALGEKGIEAGGRETYAEFNRLVEEKDLLDHVIVRQVGGVDFLGQEPVVEVSLNGTRTIYGKVKKGSARAIIESHILGGTPVKELVIK